MKTGDRVLVIIEEDGWLAHVNCYCVEGKVVAPGELESAVMFRGGIQLVDNCRIVVDRADMVERRDKLWEFATTRRRDTVSGIKQPASAKVYVGIYG